MHSGPDGTVARVEAHPLSTLHPHLLNARRIVAVTPAGCKFPVLDVHLPLPPDEHHKIGPVYLTLGGRPPVMEFIPGDAGFNH